MPCTLLCRRPQTYTVHSTPYSVQKPPDPTQISTGGVELWKFAGQVDWAIPDFGQLMAVSGVSLVGACLTSQRERPVHPLVQAQANYGGPMSVLRSAGKFAALEGLSSKLSTSCSGPRPVRILKAHLSSAERQVSCRVTLCLS
jgi:hypothetical protein